MNPPGCGAVDAGAAVAAFCAGCCGVALRSTGVAPGAVWVGGGAWYVLVPRLPELVPAPARASASDGATMITAATTASQRIFFINRAPLLNKANDRYVRRISSAFKPSAAFIPGFSLPPIRRLGAPKFGLLLFYS
jgi:NADPH:quinone reductase-like Zn-dependent oxidoreductase